MITLADVQAKLKAQYAEQIAQGKQPKRVLFCIAKSSQREAGIIKRWCNETFTLGRILYGSYTIPGLVKEIGKGSYDFLVISDTGTFRALGEYHKDGSQEVWRGSVIPPALSGLPIPVLIIPPLVDQNGLRKEWTVPEWQWQLWKDLDKVYTYKGQYNYRYTICTEQVDLDRCKIDTYAAWGIVADIETDLDNYITSIAFTCILHNGAIGHTYVLDWTVQKRFQVHYALSKEILECAPGYKVFHNGTFDMTMLMRHRVGVCNWFLDTEYMWHSWEAECKKSLAYVASIALPDYIYWKSEASTNILEYNGKDTINTARVLLWLMANMPDWAWRNYAQVVPTFLPTVMFNLEGFATDQERLAEASAKARDEQVQCAIEIGKVLALPDFDPLNPTILSSPKQLEHVLYKVYGSVFGWSKPVTQKAKKQVAKTGKAPAGTDETSLNQLALRHPMAAKITGLILRWREQSKVISTYYTAHLYGESKRLYYGMQLDGTSTGRFSCSASMFRLVTGCGAKGQVRKGDIKNYGSQIQNSPPAYKQMLMADEGYVLFNIDKSKAEAHCVALISGDKKFISSIKDTSRDFYLRLAELFFGLYTEDKKDPIRQVTKKINHATSYCMGWATFLDQVGILKLYHYMRLVGWEGKRDPKTFITYLLDGLFHGTFPGIQRWWRNTTRELVNTKGYLTTPDGAVRHFFKYPSSLRGLSPAAVAHQPQRLSVVTLNRNMAHAFYEVQLPSAFALRLKGQVHDSLVGQVLKDRWDLVEQVHRIMERPYPTSLGPLHIPCDIEGPSKHWKEPESEKA